MSSVYSINKGINRPITFKGLKAQYIWYMAGGLILLLVIFAIFYISGINTFICVALILIMGGFLIGCICRLSHKYGEHGMMKAIAKRNIPKTIKTYSRNEYIRLKKH